jgi:hypothetical protein
MANRNSGKMRRSNGLQEIEDVGLKQRVTLKIRPSLLLARAFLGEAHERAEVWFLTTRAKGTTAQPINGAQFDSRGRDRVVAI